MFNLPYVASIYHDGNCISWQLLVFYKKKEEVFLETRLIFPDVPADQFPLNVDRIERFSTQSGRFSEVELTVSKNQKKETRKNLKKELSPFG